MNIWNPLRMLRMMPVRWLALGLSASLAMISVSIMIVEKTITAEAWAILLLAPVPAGFVVTRGSSDSNSDGESVVHWPEELENEEAGTIGDPTDSGFDIPVL